jgi:uncharacterized protein (DUF1697 family)
MPPRCASSVGRFSLGSVESLALMLRAVNVGRRRVPMQALRDLLTAAGFEDVRTYLQSGNAVLRTSEPPDSVGERSRALISERFGFDVPVLVRTRAELGAVLASDPFAGVAFDPKRYWVSFLDGPPPPEAVEKLSGLVRGEERFEVRGREIYGWFPDFTARSKLATALAAPARGVTATARNWTTVGILRAMTAES